MNFGLSILIMVGVIYLQIRLSKKENKWLGLFIPIIMFMISLIAIAGLVPYQQEGTVTSVVLLVFASLIMLNIPTMILLAIYFCCRSSMKSNKQIEKMNIQDLM